MATTTAATSATSSSALTTPVSVASSSNAGAAGGSVINVSSLVSELVQATEAPQQALITNQTQAVTANISALGTLKSALSTFQSSLTALSTPTAFNSVAASSSDQDLVTATADSSAVDGTYAVTVSNLASSQQLLSGPIAGGSGATVGTGTLTLSVGGQSFNVTIDGTDNTLSGIAAAINSATGNTGITATVIQGTDGAHLLLSSSQTGAANTITVTESDGGTGLATLTYGTGNTANYKQVAAAADASFSVAGVPYTSASNTVSSAISGLTLSLLGLTATGTGTGTTPSSVNVTVSSDDSTVASNIQAFVSAYNTLHGVFTSLGNYDSTSGTAGQFLGNAVFTGVVNQVQNALYSQVGSSTYNTLASIGITTQSDGTLSLNSATLQSALASNFNDVSQLFSGTNGIASQLNSDITSALGGSGSISSYGQTLVQQENALQTQTNTLDTQMQALTASLTQQYASLNTLLSSLQTTSSFLTQQLSSLPTVQGTPNA
jgi:flagellar hook-associated protein 2